MPKVSICVPVYNVEQYISRCIESVISQSLKDIEIIIVNDCTPDKSMEIVRQYAETDKRIVIVEHDVNHGLMMARRTGYMSATGDYITFCDSDDTLAEGALEDFYAAAVKEDADIVSGTIQYVTTTGERYLWKNKLQYGSDKISIFKSLLKGECGHNLCSRLFRKELLQNHNYQTFDNFINAEDAAPKLFATCVTRERNSEASWKVYAGGTGLSQHCLQMEINLVEFRNQLQASGFQVEEKEVTYQHDGYIESLHQATNSNYPSYFRPFTRRSFISLLSLKRRAYEYEKEVRFFLIPRDSKGPRSHGKQKSDYRDIQIYGIRLSRE